MSTPTQRYPHQGVAPREVTDPTFRPRGYYKTPDGLPPVMPTEAERAAAIAADNTPAARILRDATLRLMSAGWASVELKHRTHSEQESVDVRDTLAMARDALAMAVAHG